MKVTLLLQLTDATAKNYSTLPANASNDNLYVGYTPNATVTTTYDSVQDAVDNATAGQTIYVAAGTYKEMVTITKDIKIVGNSAADTIITYNVARVVTTVQLLTVLLKRLSSTAIQLQLTVL